MVHSRLNIGPTIRCGCPVGGQAKLCVHSIKCAVSRESFDAEIHLQAMNVNLITLLCYPYVFDYTILLSYFGKCHFGIRLFEHCVTEYCFRRAGDFSRGRRAIYIRRFMGQCSVTQKIKKASVIHRWPFHDIQYVPLSLNIKSLTDKLNSEPFEMTSYYLFR